MVQVVKTPQLLQISVRGVVQGVGFRPFVYQLARKYQLTGWVCNTSGDVQIEVEGTSEHLNKFLHRLQTTPPPLARIMDISTVRRPAMGYQEFEIRPSQAQPDSYQLISPDLATCDACREEIFDPEDRRYRYPFTNCTNCGPRFTIIQDIPYDRPLTTMHQFTMCPDCQREYDDPLDRRFHAQPNACTRCGPALQLADAAGKIIPSDDVIATASQRLQQGQIVAIRGLGGFLLACDATDDAVVCRLRQRKQRPHKPLAVMLAHLAEVKQHCRVSAAEAELLASPPSPIVLLRLKPESTISPAVAPGLNYLGVMLPYTPLHHLLIRETGRSLVMTSGNLSEEPIAKDNDEAVRRLHGIADSFLLHNRDIYSRYDDSVTMVELDQTMIIRRARGYAPYPIPLPVNTKQVLACGAEQKNTFCLTKDNHAFLSQHIGDMENWETIEHFKDTIGLYQRLFRVQPEVIAADMHPDYLATQWAETEAAKTGLPLVRIQHHHAHIVSCLVDNQLPGPVIGVSFDGTGYGSDGHIWGGEFMLADYRDFQRKGHLEYLPLPGGVAAIAKPYRAAAGYLYTLFGDQGLDQKIPALQAIDEVELDLIKQQVGRGINTPLTSSCGRLFDAVSALIGVRGQIDYDAQAAIELEMVAGVSQADRVYPFTVVTEEDIRVIRLGELLAAVVADVMDGVAVAVISARFHQTIAAMTAEVCSQLAVEAGISRVVLSGGVFQNRRLLNLVTAALTAAGLDPVTHGQVPCNDGGISLGQAVIASSMVTEE